MSETLLNIQPLPSALLHSLRDIGYSMESAVADVIDNSITAEAENIYIRFSWNEGNPWFAIVDDGIGMSDFELTDAMRLGSSDPLADRKESDLGRFGLGMKTASFSQCRQLTLISKRKDGNLSCREWDLDFIENDPNCTWALRVIDEKELKNTYEISKLISNIEIQGTIVLWQKLDRYDGLEKKLNSLIDQTRNHLQLVFHRYLSPKQGKKRLNIFLNYDPLISFNPFNPKHPATQELPEQKITVEGKAVTVQPYVLPHYNKVNRSEYETYSGEGGYLQNQGFYVYRNRRLIIKGTWFRLRKKEELTKLIRVQVDITNSLDHLWKIDVKKSQASPSEIIRNELKIIINKIAESGKRVYRQRGKKLLNTIKEPAWIRIAVENKIRYEINKKHSLYTELHNILNEKQQESFKNFVMMIESSFPTALFYSDLANRPENVEKPEFSIDKYSLILDNFIQLMLKSGIPKKEIPIRILTTDPFAVYKKEIKYLLKTRGFDNEL